MPAIPCRSKMLEPLRMAIGLELDMAGIGPGTHQKIDKRPNSEERVPHCMTTQLVRDIVRDWPEMNDSSNEH